MKIVIVKMTPIKNPMRAIGMDVKATENQVTVSDYVTVEWDATPEEAKKIIKERMEPYMRLATSLGKEFEV